jgi:hypothetical protein
VDAVDRVSPLTAFLCIEIDIQAVDSWRQDGSCSLILSSTIAIVKVSEGLHRRCVRTDLSAGRHSGASF